MKTKLYLNDRYQWFRVVLISPVDKMYISNDNDYVGGEDGADDNEAFLLVAIGNVEK